MADRHGIRPVPQCGEIADRGLSQSSILQDIDEEEDDDAASTASDTTGGPDFNYILNLPLWCLTKERKDELLKQGESKVLSSNFWT